MKYNDDLLVLIIYVFLTFCFTYPLIFEITSYTVGMGDNWQACWAFWWFKYSILDLKRNPFYTNFIFYPIGMSLGSFDTMPLNSFLSIPLQLLFGLTVTYNILFLLTFILSAFGIYLLTKYLTKNKLASFIAGVIFAFSPQRMGFSQGFLNFLSVQWLPFYILYLMKFIKEKTKKYAIVSAIFLVLTSLSSWYFMSLSFIFTFFVLIWMHKEIIKMLTRKYIELVLIFSLITIIGIFPFFYPTIKAIKHLERGFQQADLAAYFIPSKLNTFFGKYVTPISFGVPTAPVSDMTLFIGYTVIFLILFCFIKCKNNKTNFWKISALIFFFWSLGENVIFLGKSLPIPLPFFFIKYLYLVNLITRLPVVSVMFFLCSTVLSVYSLTIIFNILKKSFKKFYLFIIFFIIFLIILEFLSIPIFMTLVKVPEFYKKISKEKEDYAILELPVGECPGKSCPDPLFSNFTYTFYMYYQTIHKKKILGGYLARNIPIDVINFTEETPFIRDLKYPKESLPTYIERDPSVPKTIIKNLKIKYIILHKQFWFKQPKHPYNDVIEIKTFYIDNAKQLLDYVFENETIYTDNQIIVYGVK